MIAGDSLSDETSSTSDFVVYSPGGAAKNITWVSRIWNKPVISENYEIYNYAIGGAGLWDGLSPSASKSMLTQLAHAATTGNKYDIIFLFGTPNSMVAAGRYNRYASDYAQLVSNSKTILNPGGKIVAVTMIPVIAPTEGHNTESMARINQFNNSVIRPLASDPQIIVADVHDYFAQHHEYYSGAVHLDVPLGYNALGDQIYPQVFIT